MIDILAHFLETSWLLIDLCSLKVGKRMYYIVTCQTQFLTQAISKIYSIVFYKWNVQKIWRTTTTTGNQKSDLRQWRLGECVPISNGVAHKKHIALIFGFLGKVGKHSSQGGSQFYPKKNSNRIVQIIVIIFGSVFTVCLLLSFNKKR